MRLVQTKNDIVKVLVFYEEWFCVKCSRVGAAKTSNYVATMPLVLLVHHDRIGCV